MNILLMRIMSTNDGKTSENVATKEPSTDSALPMPMLWMAVKPQYVAELMPIGPGVIWLIATMLVNSALVSQWWVCTVSICMSDNMP